MNTKELVNRDGNLLEISETVPQFLKEIRVSRKHSVLGFANRKTLLDIVVKDDCAFQHRYYEHWFSSCAVSKAFKFQSKRLALAIGPNHEVIVNAVDQLALQQGRKFG
ncbi:MAG: hypothetical protein EAZ37_00200 [Burkholderiales bacterium]|nr:MAG: hypothetical protein EAZ43_16970 [Betaproteobacteria bacterium]TAG28952.1 MAG: hypothetical protein EAZ37_00200 [Burkholderiales bacterium]TAG45836.1 MAG: hypothetical protein EAZ30_14570 [Betaproteobacteria bacterium]